MINFFLCRHIENNNRMLYKVVKSGSDTVKECTRQILKPMVKTKEGWVVKENAQPFPLVFSKLKGFSVKISNNEILECIHELNPNITDNAVAEDFKELRAYFDTPNWSDVEVWHKCGDTVLSKLLWTPLYEIPSDMV